MRKVEIRPAISGCDGEITHRPAISGCDG